MQRGIKTVSFKITLEFSFVIFRLNGSKIRENIKHKTETAKNSKKVYLSADFEGKTITALPKINNADTETDDFVKGLVLFI